MTADQRLRAAKAFWLDEQATDDQIQAVLVIAQQKKFRPKFILSRSGPQAIGWTRCNRGARSFAAIVDELGAGTGADHVVIARRRP